MTMTMDELQLFWDGILSENSEEVLNAFNSVSEEEQQACLTHLQKMTTEEGWHEAQIRSAQFALNQLTKNDNP
jgi:hypothetical protein